LDLKSLINFYSGCSFVGVDNWGILHTHLLATCLDFDVAVMLVERSGRKFMTTIKMTTPPTVSLVMIGLPNTSGIL